MTETDDNRPLRDRLRNRILSDNELSSERKKIFTVEVKDDRSADDWITHIKSHTEELVEWEKSEGQIHVFHYGYAARRTFLIDHVYTLCFALKGKITRVHFE